MAAKSDAGLPGESPAAGQTGQPAGQTQMRIRVDAQNARTGYANVFLTNATADEVILDFGLNLNMMAPPAQAGGQPDMVVQVNERIIMNYFLAKRLALTLGQLVRRHEEQFGELELDVSKRLKTKG